MPEPWQDWIPGVLSANQLHTLCEQDKIRSPDPSIIDGSSIDLSLSNEGYLMPMGSVKPWGPGYLHKIKNSGLAEPLEPNGDGLYKLEARQTYVFKLREQLHYMEDAGIYGQATAKSTIGRVDVLARLIVDGMDCYEEVKPKAMRTGSGEMFVEITPITFDVNVREGVYLSQLRLFYGKPENSEIRGVELYRTLLHRDDSASVDDGSLSVDLSPAEISGTATVAFCSHRSDQHQPIDLWKHKKSEERPSPCSYWRFHGNDTESRIRIKPGAFYILRSKELISVPGGIAVYCRATDETIGEMRIHYAGFAHPWFGKDPNNSDFTGTPLIFEVRGHDVSVNLRDAEKMARLTCYRMSEDVIWDEKYKSEYHNQTLKLSGIFQDWPSNIDVAEDGAVAEVS